MTIKKILVLSGLFFVCTCVYAQQYYITLNNDTVSCEIKKVFPRGIKIKTKEEGAKTFSSDEIKGFRMNGIPFTAKKVVNAKKDKLIFLPNDKVDRKFLYSDPNLVMISGKGVTFYELTEFGSVSTYGGRSVTVSLFIENDSLGLTKVPYMSAMFSNVEQKDVVNALYDYLKNDDETRKKLDVNESWKTFNLKGIRKLMSGYTGKDFPE